MKTIAELTDENFDQTIAAAPGPVVVDFYAPWCGPCKMLAPILDTLASEFAGKVKIVKVNVDEEPDLATRFHILSIPNLKVFRGGQVVDELIGAMPKAEIVKRLQKYLA